MKNNIVIYKDFNIHSDNINPVYTSYKETVRYLLDFR